MSADPVAIAQALIRCESVTPDEAGALTVIEDLLVAAGFEVHRPVFSEDGTPPVENLFARIGTGSPALLFAGHVDVVPPGDAALWSAPPFSGSIVDDMLVGRGAADMKGGVAASLAAALRHVEVHGALDRGSIGFLITGDEEGPAVNGTVKLLEWARARGEALDHCVLGEPTNPNALGDEIKIGRRGSLTGRLRVMGVQGHVAYPERCDNPIPAISTLICALSNTAIDVGTEHFGPSTLAFSTVDVGNPAANIVPGEARAVFNIRFNESWTHETLAAEIRARLDAAAGSAIRYEVTFDPSNSPAFLTEPGAFTDLVAEAVEAETGRKPALTTGGGTSDARFIKDYCPVVEFGLVGKTIHQIDERVAVADLERLTRIYARIIERYFADPPGGDRLPPC